MSGPRPAAVTTRPSANTLPRRGVRIDRASGSEFWDKTGKRYIDLSSQTVNTIVGQNYPPLTRAVVAALNRFTFLDQDFDCDLYDRAYEILRRLLPDHLTVVNLKMNDGSSAVEAAVKQARRHTGRPGILTVKGIYLGQNAQVIHFRGLGERPFDMLRGGTEHVVFAPIPMPDYAVPFTDSPDENGTSIARLIAQHADSLAAVIIDPIMVSSGIFGGRDMRAFCRVAAEACRAYAVPLIVDECQTFGWVPGTSLSALWDLSPDMLCLGKALAGGLPLAICASRPEFDNLCFGDADYTTGGGTTSIAAFCTVGEALLDEKEETRFIELERDFERRLENEVRTRQKKLRTRGVGLIRCLEWLGPGDEAERTAAVRSISAEALRKGVYVRTYGPRIGLKPSRIIPAQVLDEGLDILFSVIDDEASRGDRPRDYPPATDFSF